MATHVRTAWLSPCAHSAACSARLFILDWLQSVELRRRVCAGLNKGEARNASARAVSFYWLGKIRDHGIGQQRYRASGLNL